MPAGPDASSEGKIVIKDNFYPNKNCEHQNTKRKQNLDTGNKILTFDVSNVERHYDNFLWLERDKKDMGR